MVLASIEKGPLRAHAPYRILVVEDNPLQLQLAKDLFTLQTAAAGRFQIVTARTLADALDEIERSSFDAVLLDLTLPDSRGLDTFRALHSAAPQTAIVVWSGHDEQVALTAMREGAHEYLPKGDVSPAQLIRTMSHLIERARAERTAMKDRHRMATILDATPDAVKVLDMHGLITQVNRAGAALLEADAKDIIGRSAYDVIHADYHAYVAGLLARVIAGENVEAELELVTFKGNLRWVSSRAVPLRDSGNAITAILAITRDITDAKRIEEDLRRTQEQLLHVQKLEAVGRLAGGVAHDFNNLLTAISGHADLLLEQLDGKESARVEVDEIKHGVQRAAALTRQLLAFSRKQVMQPVVLDLHSVVTDTRRLLDRLIGENIELVTKRGERDATVRADRSQIEQVIMNLVVNSRDAMPRGGHISISTDVIEVTRPPNETGVPRGRYATLTVSDTGTGIDTEVMRHIFEPFYTTKEIGKGTGLGLATVFGIVKQSGGYIDLHSDAGKGTTFEVLFPYVEEPVVRESLPMRSPDVVLSGTILIVEDEKTVRDIACRVLTRAGYEVITAADGIQALEIAGEQLASVDLVLTDVMMPNLNGPELVKRLLEMRSDLRVLFTSGYTDDAVFPPGMVADMGFLEKPFTPAALLDAVRKAIGTQKQSH